MHEVAERRPAPGRPAGCATNGPNGVAERGLHAERGEEIERRIHAEHHEIALGEIDHPHDAEDQPEPDAHQAVDRADQKAGGQRLQKTFQRLASPMTSRRVGIHLRFVRRRRGRLRSGHSAPHYLLVHIDHDAGRSSRPFGWSRQQAAMTRLSGSDAHLSTSSFEKQRALAADDIGRSRSKACTDLFRRRGNDIVEAPIDGISVAQGNVDIGALVGRERGGEAGLALAAWYARRDGEFRDRRFARNCLLRARRARAQQRR